MADEAGALYELQFRSRPLYCVPFKASRELLEALRGAQAGREGQADAGQQAGTIRWGGSDGKASHVRAVAGPGCRECRGTPRRLTRICCSMRCSCAARLWVGGCAEPQG